MGTDGDPALGLAAGDGVRASRLTAICALAARSLPVDGASVTVAAGTGHRGLIMSTDTVAVRLEDLQAGSGEGPGIDSFAGGHPVLGDDLADPASVARWPFFSSAARDAGAMAVYALPLRIGVINLGVLMLYRRESGGLEAEELAEALRIADAAAYVVLDMAIPVSVDGTDHDGWYEGPTEAVFVGAEVHQASGVLMVQLGIPIEAALARLRAHAFVSDRPLAEVAREVVAHTLKLER